MRVCAYMHCVCVCVAVCVSLSMSVLIVSLHVSLSSLHLICVCHDVRTSIHPCTYLPTCTHKYMYTYTYVHTKHLHVYVCMYTMNLKLYKCVYTYTLTYLCMYSHIHAQIPMPVLVQLRFVSSGGSLAKAPLTNILNAEVRKVDIGRTSQEEWWVVAGS